MNIAVVGAHLSGLPLNSQLTERGGKLVRATRTKPVYRLFALPGSTPPKPGMLRVAENGAAIELEVWDLPVSAFGEFVGLIPPPLCIGTIEVEDDQRVQGFLVEAYAVANAKDITEYRGWRAYLAASTGKKSP